jgi:hypothetical protein
MSSWRAEGAAAADFMEGAEAAEGVAAEHEWEVVVAAESVEAAVARATAAAATLAAARRRCLDHPADRSKCRAVDGSRSASFLRPVPGGAPDRVPETSRARAAEIRALTQVQFRTGPA